MDSIIFDFNKKQFFKNYNSNYLELNKHLYNQLLHISKLTSVDFETLFYDIFYKQHLKIKLPNSTIETAKNWNKSAIQKFINEDNIVKYLQSNYGLEEVQFNPYKNSKLFKTNKYFKFNVYHWKGLNEDHYKTEYHLIDLIKHKYSKGVYFEDLKRFKKRKYKDPQHRFRFLTKLSRRLKERTLVKDFLSKYQDLNKNFLLIVHKDKKAKGDNFEHFYFLYVKNNEYIKLGHSLNEDMSNKIVLNAYVL